MPRLKYPGVGRQRRQPLGGRLRLKSDRDWRAHRMHRRLYLQRLVSYD